MQADLLGFLGLMRRAGKLNAGEDGVREAVRKHTANLILLAADASPNTEKRAESFAESAGVPLVRLSVGKDELCQRLGVNGGALFAVCDTGFARSFMQKLGEEE